MNFIMKKQLEMKKGSKKGFTLVEVIVVIVIIAILAAIAIPALTGYIERANQRAAVVDARTITTAMQTMVSDRNYSSPAFVPGSASMADWAAGVTTLTGRTTVAGDITSVTVTGDTVTGAVLSVQGKTVTFSTNPTKFVVS